MRNSKLIFALTMTLSLIFGSGVGYSSGTELAEQDRTRFARPFTGLPDELQDKITHQVVDLSSLVYLTRTCKYWHATINDVIQNRVFIIGSTGAGKSTLIHLFLGKRLEAEGTSYQLNAIEKIPNLVIEHKMKSGTLELTPVVDFANKRVLFDCPGFGDTRGVKVDIENTKKLSQRMQGNAKVSVVFVENEDLFFSAPGLKGCSQDILKLTQIIPNQSQLEQMVFVVITKQKYRTAVQNLNALIDPNNPDYLCERGNQLVQFLVANPSHLLDVKQPTQMGPFTPPAGLAAFMQNWSFVKNSTLPLPEKKTEELDKSKS